jgi:ABC-2 type transport system ATP-binding protein
MSGDRRREDHLLGWRESSTTVFVALDLLFSTTRHTPRDGGTREPDDETALAIVAIPPGHVYGFLGPNGAGKTTTMRMLATLMSPTAGTATIVGTPLGDRDAVTPHIGYLPEKPPLYKELAGREQLSYVAFLHDIPDDAAANRIEELRARLDMTDGADRRISTYALP